MWHCHALARSSLTLYWPVPMRTWCISRVCWTNSRMCCGSSGGRSNHLHAYRHDAAELTRRLVGIVGHSPWQVLAHVQCHQHEVVGQCVRHVLRLRRDNWRAGQGAGWRKFGRRVRRHRPRRRCDNAGWCRIAPGVGCGRATAVGVVLWAWLVVHAAAELCGDGDQLFHAQLLEGVRACRAATSHPYSVWCSSFASTSQARVDQCELAHVQRPCVNGRCSRYAVVALKCSTSEQLAPTCGVVLWHADVSKRLQDAILTIVGTQGFWEYVTAVA